MVEKSDEHSGNHEDIGQDSTHLDSQITLQTN